MNLTIFPLTDAAKFEDLCLALWRRILSDPHAQFVGRKGQAQQGVDIIGRKDGTLNWVGVQCKVRSGGELSEADVLDDAEKAKQFNPSAVRTFLRHHCPQGHKDPSCGQRTDREEREGWRIPGYHLLLG